MKTVTRILSVVLALFFIPGALAQKQTFTVDAGASKVAFALNGTGHHVEGTFHVQSGAVDFDPSAQKISGSIVVAAGSGESGEASRDKKMNGDVLDVAHYAQVTFEPKTYQGTLATTGDSTIQVSGVFTLHGTPQDMTVPMQLHFEGSALNAKTHFVVPYVKWGLKDPSIFILKVAKDVDIDLTLVGKVSAGN